MPGSGLEALHPRVAAPCQAGAARAPHHQGLGDRFVLDARGGASSPAASYPARLEGELEKLFPGVDVDVVKRGISGEIAAGAADRLRDTVAEVEPDLLVWQVGTNDALARVELNSPLTEVIGPRSPHYTKWAFAVLATTCCGSTTNFRTSSTGC